MFLPVALSRAIHRTDDVLRGRGVWSLHRRLEETGRFTRDRLVELQSAKLKRLVAHAVAHSPYWTRLFRERGLAPEDVARPSDLSKLPILTRETLRAHRDDIRSRGLPDGDMLPNSTGGSTGSNVSFWVDRECWRWRDAVTLGMWGRLGLRPGTPVVQVWGSPMDEKRARRIRQRLRFFLDNRRLVTAYALDDASLTRLSRTIGTARPGALMGYASVLDLLASRVSRGAVPWTPIEDLVIVSASETLFDEQRRNIERVLGGRVANLYGCREFGLVALECPAGSLHLTEERLIVETIPQEHGLGGKLVITDLDNRAFPFLRYEIGDLADGDPLPCPCGRSHRRLSAVRGRTFDVIRSPEGLAVGGTFWSLLLRTAVSGIDTWQVVQREPDLLEIRTTPVGGLQEAGRERIRDEVGKALGAGMRVVFGESDRLEPSPSGKHRFVIAAPAAGANAPSR